MTGGVVPKVSICIPAYKEPEFLRRTLQSVSIQSFDDFEVIITDDSPDETVWNVVKEFSHSKKIKYSKNKERKGSPENWNEALRKASGEYIKFLHHDDWFSDKNSLLDYVKMLDDNPEVPFAFSSSLAYGPEQKFKFNFSISEKQLNKLHRSYDSLIPTNLIGSPSATIYRRKINKSFDARLKWVVDIDFYIEILKDNPSFVFCSRPLICITDGAAHQVTRECQNNKNLELFEWLYLYKKVNKNVFPNFRHLNFIWSLLCKYKVKSTDEIVEIGINRIPKPIKAMILIRNFINLK